MSEELQQEIADLECQVSDLECDINDLSDEVLDLKDQLKNYTHEAKRTVSKYLTVINPKTKSEFKVRFSNHKPNKKKELLDDCDFFVGFTHAGVTTTVQAVMAVAAFFSEENAALAEE